MNKKISGLIWGLLLILGGVAALAETQGYFDALSPVVWAVVFAVISVVSLALYFLSGVQNWGILFPVGIFGALAVLLTMVVNGVDRPAVAAPLFVGLAVPFVVAYFLDTRKNWWAIIPTGVMVFLVFVMFMADSSPDELIGSALFFILALTFGAVYATRRATWAVIVAYIMLVLGFLPMLSSSDYAELAGVAVLLAVALPFWFVYLRNAERRWWALIPAGIITTIGLLAGLVLLPVSFGRVTLLGLEFEPRLTNAFLCAGVAATFAILWLRHHMRWAMIVAFAAAGLAVIVGLLSGLDRYWPVLLIAAGIYLIYANFRSKQPEQQPDIEN